MKGTCFLLCLLWFCPLLFSQSFWSLEQYTSREGLPNEVVTAVAKDEQGFLWVGTGNGLTRFDGSRFTLFKGIFADSTLVLPLQISGLLASPGSALWVSTRKGLFVCNTVDRSCRLVDLPERRDENTDNDWISPLVMVGDYAWGLTTRYLVRLDPKDHTCRFFLLPRHQPTFFTFSGLTADQDGYLWMVIDYQVYSFHPATGRFELAPFDTSPDVTASIEAWSILADSNDNLWCGTRNNGLYRLDRKEGRFIPYAAPGLFVRSIGRVGAELWLGGGGRGLYRLEEGTAQLQDLSSLYPSGHNGSWANQVLYDSTLQLIWIATQKGLEKIDLAHLHFQSQPLTIATADDYPPFILNVLPDRAGPRGHYWLKVIDQGLYRWSPAGQTLERMAGAGIGKANECLVQDGQGRIWINQYREPQLQVYDPALRRWLPPPVPSPYLNCSYLYVDRHGDVWLGTFDNRVGIYHGRTGTFEPLPYFDQLISQAEETDIVAITEDAIGQTWVLTDLRLFCIGPSKETVRPVDLSAYLPEGAFLLSLMASSDGHLWVGGREGALALDRDGKLVRQFRATDPMPLSFVYQMVEDARRQIWFGTPTGLFCTEEKSGGLRKFDQKDGLWGENAYFLSADPSGRVFVGFPAALNYIDTHHWPAGRVPAPLVISELRVLDIPRDYTPGATLRLRGWENFFTLRPALLNFRRPSDTRYAYRLQGFEEQWHELDADAPITYTNLDAGRYQLEIRAHTERDPAQIYDLVLPIRVIPPFYESWWFFTLIGLAVIGIVSAFLYYRQRQLLQLQLLRQRIARDLHDDVGSSLSSIRFFSEYIRQGLTGTAPQAAIHLERISQSAAHISENMREIIWALQARADDLDSLVAKIREYGARLMESRNIQFKTAIDPAFTHLKMDIHHQRDLYLICKESFNNAAKYADCSQLEWAIEVLPGRRWNMVIRDNGRGFDPAAVTTGNGLPSLEKRAKEMNGRLVLISAPGQGVMIRLECG